MANVISLQTRQVFLSAGEPAAYAQAYFRINNTDTLVNVYSDADLLSVRSQPVTADADGVLPPCYISGADAIRILLTDEDDVPLPGYPMDDVTPIPISAGSAAATSFSPTAEVPEVTVQAAVEYVAGLFGDQSSLITRTLTPYDTGGTGNAYSITPSPAITAYGGGQSFLVRPNRSNTGAATLDVNGLGARSLRKTDSSGSPQTLAAGEIQAGREFAVYDDGTYLLITIGRDYPIRSATSNGEMVRFSDGTQICTKTLTAQGPVSTSDGNLFTSAAIATGSWVASFTALYGVEVSAYRAAAGISAWAAIRVGPSITTGPTVVILTPTTSGATDYVIRVTAIGKWN